jgi:hypothetical protein
MRYWEIRALLVRLARDAGETATDVAPSDLGRGGVDDANDPDAPGDDEERRRISAALNSRGINRPCPACVAIACNRCGFVSHHTLSGLGL